MAPIKTTIKVQYCKHSDCQVSGFRHGVDKVSVLLCCYELHVDINFRFSPCIITVNHFYYPTNALNYIKLIV